MPSMQKPMSCNPYITGLRRIRVGWFSIAICEVWVNGPEHKYWKRATSSEWQWSKLTKQDEVSV